MKLWGSDPTPFSFISAFQFARIHTSSLINIEKILNRPVTKFYNCHYINVSAAWSWLTKTRPTSKAWKTKLKFLAYCINCFRVTDNLAWKWKYLPAIAKAQSHNGLIGYSCWELRSIVCLTSQQTGKDGANKMGNRLMAFLLKKIYTHG